METIFIGGNSQAGNVPRRDAPRPCGGRTPPFCAVSYLLAGREDPFFTRTRRPRRLRRMTMLEKGLRLVAQHLAALRATTGEDLPAIGGLHALHEAVLLLAMDFLRLMSKCTIISGRIVVPRRAIDGIAFIKLFIHFLHSGGFRSSCTLGRGSSLGWFYLSMGHYRFFFSHYRFFRNQTFLNRLI